MATNTHQVFFSTSGRRMKALRGVLLTAGVIAVVAALALGTALLQPESVSLPRLSRGEIYKRILQPERFATFATAPNLAYRAALARIDSAARAHLKRRHRTRSHLPENDTETVRAAFYVNWDAHAYYSLLENVDRISMLFPEWLFVPAAGDTVASDIDQRALSLIRSHGIRCLPMVTNYVGGKWDGAAVRRIVERGETRSRFIASILSVIESNGFHGVNIDFEELGAVAGDDLTAFQRELYEALRPRGYLVTQDVAPYNEDYDLRALSAVNNYLVLMAYDQHFPSGQPGPVADHKWVEGVLDKTLQEVPASKVILGLGAYGYDWPDRSEAEDISYQEALVRAREAGASIRYDNDSYNLTFSYADDNEVDREVWFTDAATSFNAMRAGADFGVAGVALWRLGSEDPRIWSFFARSLRVDSLALRDSDVPALTRSTAGSAIDFEGEGEILDPVATPEDGQIEIEYDARDGLIQEERYRELPSSYVIRKYGTAKGTIVLTFDDGPSREYTPAILDTLIAERVPATFFIVGAMAESNLDILRRIYAEGFELGDHTFSHPNLAEVNQTRVELELKATRRLIESATGHSTVLFRAPYNADSEPETMQELLPIVEAKAQQFYTVGESIDPQDWAEGMTADSIVARVIAQEGLGSVILLHDAGGNRDATVQALPRIIRYFRVKGYTFTDVSGLIGLTRDAVMPPLGDPSDRWYSRINWAIAEVIFAAQEAMYLLFLVALLLALARMLFIFVLAIAQGRKIRREKPVGPAPRTGLVSVIVPAYNEELHAADTIANLLLSESQEKEIVFVDDGSTDGTLDAVRRRFGSDPRVEVLAKPNGGKASALNAGIARARGEIVVCIDADTRLRPDAIPILLEQLSDSGVAAVAGNVKVGNEGTILTRWQAIEYITSQNADRRAFDLLNCITVIPGAIGAFRKKALLQIGGFSSDTLAEDCDVTIRLLRERFIVRYNERAIAYTEAPSTFRTFIRQRFRWSFGIMQNIWKHRDALFDSDFGTLGWVALPNMLVFQILLPLLSPVADAVMILSLLTGEWERVLIYYLLFIVVDLVASASAFLFERERLSRLWLLFPQRFVYRQLMYWVLIKSALAAVRGTLVGWGVLKRTGLSNIPVTSP